MTRIILALIIVVLATTTSFAQDNTDFIPDYGIELMQDSMVLSDGTLIVNTVTTFPPRFCPTYVVFYFNIESFNATDSIQLKTKKNVEGVIRQKQLNHLISGKKVYEWLDMLYSPRISNPSDTTIIKVLGIKAYNNLVKGKD